MCNRAPWRTALLLGLLLAVAEGCRRRVPPSPSPPPLAIPHGFTSTLQVTHGEHLYRFGPFVGYYFRPTRCGDFSRIELVCFNQRGFYSSDMPVGAKLFTGQGILQELESVEGAIPKGDGRIQPVFFQDAPDAWTTGRPQPQEEFLHFHSMHDAAGPTLVGYWLSHRAVADFTYDMGGRVNQSSPLWHRVRRGADQEFPRIIEFDSGPEGTPLRSQKTQ